MKSKWIRFRSRPAAAAISAFALGFGVLPCNDAVGQPKTDTILILDASNSMWGQIDGKNKVVIARDALRKTLVSLPADTRLGLVAYGHRSPTSCTSVQSIAPIAPVDAVALAKKINKIKPLGRTPIANSLTMAANELKTSSAARIVLLTDGPENCGVNICTFTGELAKRQPGLAVHVVAFDVDEKVRAKLDCIAKNTGGTVFPAKDGASLTAGLKQAFGAPAAVSSASTAKKATPPKGTKTAAAKPVAKPAVPAPPPAPEKPRSGSAPKSLAESAGLDTGLPKSNIQGLHLTAMPKKGEAPIEHGPLWYVYTAEANKQGERLELRRNADARALIPLASGNYHVVMRYGEIQLSRAVTVRDKALTRETFAVDVGQIHASVATTDADANTPGPPTSISVIMPPRKGQRGERIIASSDTRAAVLHVPAGDYIVRARQGLATSEDKVSIDVGGKTAVALALNTGRVRLTATATKGGRPLKRVLYVVQRYPEQAVGKLRQLAIVATPQPELTLSPGHYRILVRQGQAGQVVDVKVEAGKTIARSVILNSGRLKLAARLKGTKEPLKRDVEYAIFALPENGDGKPREILRAAQPRHAVFLRAGNYRVVSRFGSLNATAESTVAVKAGGVTETMFEHDAGFVRLQVAPGEGAAEQKPGQTDMVWVVLDKDGKELGRSERSRPELALAAGDYVAVARLGQTEVRVPFSLGAGETKTVEAKSK